MLWGKTKCIFLQNEKLDIHTNTQTRAHVSATALKKDLKREKKREKDIEIKMPATTRHQRVKKALHLFDLPRETLLLILQREDVTATDLARFSCVSKGEKAREIAMEAAKNRVKSAWPESELNYKTEEDRERWSDLRRQLSADGLLGQRERLRVAAGENDDDVDDENDDKNGKRRRRRKEAFSKKKRRGWTRCGFWTGKSRRSESERYDSRICERRGGCRRTATATGTRR